MIMSNLIFKRWNGAVPGKIKGVSLGTPCYKCGGPRKFGMPCRPCLREYGKLYQRKHRAKIRSLKSQRNGITAFDCIDKKHGMLTALEVVHKQGVHGRFLRCVCECGQEKIVKFDNLGTVVKSCGCLLKIRLKEKTLPSGMAARNAVAARYRYVARKTGRMFCLTDSEMDAMFSSKCSYCGSHPSGKETGKTYNGDFIYSGIDRVDNTKGYVHGNVVPCCEICNRLKGSLTPSNWNHLQQHFEKIVRHRASKVQLAA